jgi:Skp family chaperone for outer membrane proteins
MFRSFLFFLFITFSAVTSARAVDNNFASINIQKITESCSVFQDIRNQMNDEFKKVGQKFDEKAKVLGNEEASLAKKQAVLEQNAFKKQVEELNSKKYQTQFELEKEKQKLQKIYFDAISVVNKKMNDVIKDHAEKKGYKVVFESSTLVYNSLSDVTSDIIQALNKEISSYRINFNVDPGSTSDNTLKSIPGVNSDSNQGKQKQ